LLGVFEEQVLLAVVRLGEHAYGMTVRRELEERTGRAVSIGAVYATLDRMEAKGWVRSFLESGDPRRGGRARKLVGLEPAGAQALRRALDLHGRMWEGVDPTHLLDEGGA
jgi:PadR family transcriptional regulator PadR